MKKDLNWLIFTALYLMNGHCAEQINILIELHLCVFVFACVCVRACVGVGVCVCHIYIMTPFSAMISSEDRD